MSRSATSAQATVRQVRHAPAAVIAVATAVLLLTGCAGQDTTASPASPGQTAALGAPGSETPATSSGAGQGVAALDRQRCAAA